jgi:Arc/MetJ family transcription regulator
MSVTRTLIDVDDELLAAAARSLGTRTKRDTVNGALRAVAAAQVRRQELEDFVSGRLGDPEVLKDVRTRGWRH